MPRNVEVKIRIEDPDAVRTRLREAGEAEAESILDRLGLRSAPRIPGSYADLGDAGEKTVP